MSGSEKKKYTIKFISEYIDASIVGDADLEIHEIASIENAQEGSITFLSNPSYSKLLEKTNASAVILKENIKTSFDHFLARLEPTNPQQAGGGEEKLKIIQNVII